MPLPSPRIRQRREVPLAQPESGIHVVQQRRAGMTGGHELAVRRALFIVHPGERTAFGVRHDRLGLPVHPVGPLDEQPVTEVDVRQHGQTDGGVVG